MPEITTNEVKDYLNQIQGKEITLTGLRKEFNILPGAKSFDLIRNILFRLVEQRIVRPTGKQDGTYKVIVQVEPIRVFIPGREHRPPFDLIFPRDFDTKLQMDFAEDIVIREGDLILISGMSNYGKTTLCLNFCGENIDKRPVLMGNEYSILVSDKTEKENTPSKNKYEPSPRFLTRLETMNIKNEGGWVDWVDDKGNDKFTLLPVRDDYAEHIIRDKINIIDWINIATGEHYMIGTVLEGIKKQLGRGLAIVALQKAEGATAGRGGQFTKDFADLEILVDKLGESDVLLTIGKVKEFLKPVIGKTYGYIIGKGVKILNFREIKRCPHCHASGYIKGEKCGDCGGTKYIDK